MQRLCIEYVLILLFINRVCAIERNCSFVDIDKCDECIRCRGYWCNDPNETIRCARELYDNWCNHNQEAIPTIPEALEEGQYFNYKFRARTVYRNIDEFQVSFSSDTDEPKVNVFGNSTQNPNLNFDANTECLNGKCTTLIESDPGTDFCNSDGRVHEFYTIKLSAEGFNEEVNVKNHVPCACQCSEVVEQQSEMCNAVGNYSCGTCTCERGWTGKSCEVCSEIDNGSMNDMCNGRGSYRCGECACENNWTGKSCEVCKEVDNRSMNHMCNGRGSYRCSECVCENNWTGKSCEVCSEIGDGSMNHMCNGRGFYRCGECVCESNWTGKSCEVCSEIDNGSINHMCNGRGSYRCGECVCENNWTGKSCEVCSEIDNGSMNHMCNGRGSYRCDECVCENNWSGKSCEVCKEMDLRSMNYMCNGRGSYRCGECVCDNNWSGKTCEVCDDIGSVADPFCHWLGSLRCGICFCVYPWNGPRCETLDMSSILSNKGLHHKSYGGETKTSNSFGYKGTFRHINYPVSNERGVYVKKSEDNHRSYGCRHGQDRTDYGRNRPSLYGDYWKYYDYNNRPHYQHRDNIYWQNHQHNNYNNWQYNSHYN